MARQQEALNFLKSDARLKKELEFEARLQDLLSEYSFSFREVAQILDPQARQRGVRAFPVVDGRSQRKLKVYHNPHTGEVLKTKGGNHRVLKQWKSEHGSVTVEGWLTN
ncbi:hypothetical protein HDC30_002478 [Pseudomonas sp. JAI115]|nr:hypothetical protein [Pseudomonas sp. JAI115]